MNLLQPAEVILQKNLAVSVNPKTYNELWEYRGNPARGGESVETTRERL